MTVKYKLARLGIAIVGLISSSAVFGQTSLSLADRAVLARVRTTPSAEFPLSTPLKSPLKARCTAPAQSPKIGLLVRFDSEEALDNAIADGLEVRSRFGHRAVVAAPVVEVDATLSLPGVRGAALLKRRHLLNSTTRSATGVNQVQAGEKLPAAYGGEGVFIGFYDGGIDASHINFRGSDGLPRIQNLWCYPVYDGWFEDAEAGIAPPDDMLLEEYIGPEAVAQFMTDDPYETHGTHVMGIAAGSYVHATDKDYHGMAPRADMLVACGRLDDYSIMDGVKRIAEYAYESGRPCVINMSLGYNSGPHDGTDEFTSFFNDIVDRYGVSICMAAGNEGSKAISLVKTLTLSDTSVSSLVISPMSSSAISSSFEVWASDASPLDISLNFYVLDGGRLQKVHSIPLTNEEKTTFFLTTDRDEVGNVDPEANVVQNVDATLSQYYTRSMICGIKGVDDVNGRYSAYFDLDLTPGGEYENTLFAGVTVSGAPGQKVFLYSPDESLMFNSMGLSGFDAPNGNGSINSMACGPNTIAVGAYNPAVMTGAPYGKVCSFSSWSEMWDGSVLPHVVAPGNSITSSVSGYYKASGMLPWPIDEVNEDGKNYYWSSRSGTSMACPVVTGILALWLSANPSLTPAELREVLVSTAAPASDASKAWGAGRVNAFAGIVEALALNEINNVSTDSPAIFLDTDADNHVIACRGTSQITVRLFSLSGMSLGEHHVAGDVITVPLSQCPSGVYLIQVTADHASMTFKFKS